jgi:myosin heavy subunit
MFDYEQDIISLITATLLIGNISFDSSTFGNSIIKYIFKLDTACKIK